MNPYGQQKEMMVEIYSNTSNAFGAGMQEALKTYMKDAGAELAQRFAGTKLTVIGVSGDVLKVAISYQSNDPNAVGQAYFEAFGSIVGGAIGGGLVSIGGTVLGGPSAPLLRIGGAVLGSVIGGKVGESLARDTWTEVKDTGFGNWMKYDLLGLGDLGIRVSAGPVASPSSPVQADTKIHIIPNTSATDVEVWRNAPNGSFVGPAGQVLTRDPNASNGNYTIQKGDTLWEIARDNGISYETLRGANPQITHPDLIHPGQVINAPHAPADNSRLTIGTTTTLSPFDSVASYEAQAGQVGLGRVVSDPLYFAALPLAMVNGDGYWHTELGGIVTDGLRPGNFNLSDAFLNDIADEAIGGILNDPGLFDLGTPVC